MKGRVVDDCMMDALKAGCFRIGDRTSRSFYTLNHIYSVDERHLQEIAHTIIKSGHGLRLTPANPRDVKLMIRCGQMAIESRLVYHNSVHGAVVSLDNARNEEPSTEERMLQLSVGGDPNSMMIGRFLPCQATQNSPDVKLRCACGFAVWLKRDAPADIQSLLHRSARCPRDD